MEMMMRIRLAAGLLLAGTLIGAHGAGAQLLNTLPGVGNVASTTPISPFAVNGYIENFTNVSQGGAACPVMGGIITVSGQQIVIPDNTIVVMPASQLTVCDIFQMAPPASKANGQSGLALNDVVKPLAAFEVNISGNIVGGKWIAGLVWIAQEFLHIHQGYISNIDYATGDFCISQNALPPGPLPAPRAGCLATESRVKLNDPVGRYGRQRTEGDQDPRFVVDDGNPTVHAGTGYPMCIPRVAPPTIDPVCPIANRPIDPPAGLAGSAAAFGGGTGRPLTRFVMDTVNRAPVVPGAAPIVGSTDIIACRNGLKAGQDCDSTQQAPMMIGDSVLIQATRAKDSSPVNGGIFMSAWQVVDSAGIYTRPCGSLGTNPITDPTGSIAGLGKANTKCNPMKDITYMEWEVGLVGAEGANGDGVLVEVTDRIKVLGFTTDPSTQIEIYAIDSRNNLRWIANVIPERIVFGRYDLFFEQNKIKNINVAVTGGPIPIVSNHLGLDLGAPRQFFVHQAKSEALLNGKQRPHNVKPIPGVCGGLIFAGCPTLNGGPVPTTADMVNPATGKVFTIANGLVPSQYFQPLGVDAYLFPENVQLGDPLAVINHECLDFLVGGWALHTPALDAAAAAGTLPPYKNAQVPGQVGVNQLNPWPGGMTLGALAPAWAMNASGVPAGVVCESTAPAGG
jgi:hypothetical protein